jgi:hypothetical protein
MKKPTKKERHAIYKEALRLYKDDREPFICNCVGIATDWKYTEGILLNLSLFPELLAQRPKGASLSWWPVTNDHTPRIKALNKCIRLTAPKPRKKP